jgi:hypothetical protein
MKVPPGLVATTTSDIVIVPAQEAFHANTRPSEDQLSVDHGLITLQVYRTLKTLFSATSIPLTRIAAYVRIDTLSKRTVPVAGREGSTGSTMKPKLVFTSPNALVTPTQPYVS